MPFQKGHKPYSRKQPLVPSKDPNPDQIAAGLMEGVTLPTMKLRDQPIIEIPKKPGKVVERKPAPPNSDDVESILPLLVRALERIAEGQENSRDAARHALERAHKAQFPQGVRRAAGVSVFNPQGETQYPRPDLKCRMFLPWQAEKETLTVEEIHLLNLLEDGDYKVKRNDGTKMTVTVKLQMNNMTGKPERLLMNSETGFGNLRHRQVIPLSEMLRQILGHRVHTREAASRIPTMEELTAMVESGELPISKAVEY